MKRELNKEEKEIYDKQLKVHQEKLDRIKERTTYNKSVIDFNKIKRDFDDKWRPMLRKQKEYEDKLIIEGFEQDIKNEEAHIKDIEGKLKEGVERSPSLE